MENSRLSAMTNKNNTLSKQRTISRVNVQQTMGKWNKSRGKNNVMKAIDGKDDEIRDVINLNSDGQKTPQKD